MEISRKLKSYIPLADMLVESFANKCEVVIHDLKAPKNSVVYVANGSITNRQIGQSFDHLVKDVLLSKDFRNDYKANYTFRLRNGEKIKSSTSLIRDENGDVIGAFCINFEIDEFVKMKSFLDMFLKDDDHEEVNENICIDEMNSLSSFENVSQIIDTLIDDIIGEIDVTRMKRSDNIELLSFMYDKGIFLTKGSIDKVAERLQVSRVTIYSYLDEIKKKKHNNAK